MAEGGQSCQPARTGGVAKPNAITANTTRSLLFMLIPPIGKLPRIAKMRNPGNLYPIVPFGEWRRNGKMGRQWRFGGWGGRYNRSNRFSGNPRRAHLMAQHLLQW